MVLFVAVMIFVTILSPLGQNFFGKKSDGSPQDQVRLGLDLKGGIELVLAPDYRLGSTNLFRVGDELVGKMQGMAPKVDPLGVLDGDRYDGLKFTFANANDVERAKNLGIFNPSYSTNLMGENKTLLFQPKYSGNTVELTVNEDPRDFGDQDEILNRSIAIINNRISEKSGGVPEADIRKDGKGRIVAQLPGVNTLQDARDLVTATGRLTFRINNQIVLDGTDMKDINVGLDPNRGGYVINFAFKGEGAKQLEKITTDNVGKNMAVYLDENELMNPVIQNALTSGSGQISFGNNTSKDQIEKYALLMKSGALPVSFHALQATQVAPTLGKQMVQQSVVAGIAGMVIVVAFMIMFYSFPGLLADGALIIYAIFVLGVMAVLRQVLTLPGVAGFILGIGMAVDANIIIFERIKDELRNGKRLRPAVHAGFDRAFVTILDSNITTLICAGVLFFFGTGPVQGFAVTLSISILISMISAITITRMFIDWKIDHDPDRYAKYFGIKEVLPQ
jgi:preprotein translocase subunit SecD